MSSVAGQQRLLGPSDAAEEMLIWQASRAGSVEAREKLFELHLPFARRIAARYHRQRSLADIEFADFFQLACTGLLEAVDRFDPHRGIPFRGYAARRISGSILDGISRMTEMNEQLSFRKRLQRERLASLMPALGEASKAHAVAVLAELAVGLAVGFMLEGTGLVASEMIDPTPGPYEGLAFKRTVRRLNDEMARLPERERQILHFHYHEGLIFEQIGMLLGITKGRVSQLHRGALASLRKKFVNAGHFGLER